MPFSDSLFSIATLKAVTTQQIQEEVDISSSSAVYVVLTGSVFTVHPLITMQAGNFILKTNRLTGLSLVLITSCINLT